MFTSINVAVVYQTDGAVESFIAATEDEVMEQITDWIKETYSNLDQYHLEETLDYFLEAHSMEIIHQVGQVEVPVEELHYLGLFQFENKVILRPARNDVEMIVVAERVLKNDWSLYSSIHNVEDNLDVLEDEHGEDAFTYQHKYR